MAKVEELPGETAAAAAADTIMEMVSKAASDLYTIRDTYFPAKPEDKLARLKAESDQALKLLHSIPPDQRKSRAQRATYEYLWGKLLDVFPDHSKEAEEHLSKAVKLSQSLADAWLCLGSCIWKRGVLTEAENCYKLALSKAPDKKILCQLSMLERKMAQGSSNAAEIVNKSIDHAKEAIMLDVKDGYSWYNLGNACLTCFFVTGASDLDKLLGSLKAYQNAEKDESMNTNPDLYFNCATVHKYLENYERALSGFEAAASRDPALNATEEVRKIVNLLDKLDNLLTRQAMARRPAFLASTATATNLNPSYTRAIVENLVDGLNKGVAIDGKVLFFVTHENVSPLYYLLCDLNQNCFALSVYGMRDDAIKIGDQVTLLDPNFRNINFSWKGKSYHFKSMRVDFLEQVLVNGKALSSTDRVIRTSIHAQHKA